jgi:hypothetical protein
LVIIEIEKRQRNQVHVDLPTGNRLLDRARREMVMELGELIRQPAPECLGHLRIPSGVMGITPSMARWVRPSWSINEAQTFGEFLSTEDWAAIAATPRK